VDQDAAHADAPQQENVLRQGQVGLPIDRGSAQLHDDRLAGELPDVRQRFHQHACGFCGAHDVLLFSLM